MVFICISLAHDVDEHVLICLLTTCLSFLGFLGGSVIKNPLANAEDSGSIPELGRSPGGGNGNPLQYSYLGNLIDKRSLVGYSPWGFVQLKRVGHDLATQQQQHIHWSNVYSHPLPIFKLGCLFITEL